jgi:hypothetical protein
MTDNFKCYRDMLRLDLRVCLIERRFFREEIERRPQLLKHYRDRIETLKAVFNS